MEAAAPRQVVDVSADTTRAFDVVVKLEEYKPSLRHIVLIDIDEPKISHYSRADDSPWTYRPIDGMRAIPDIPVSSSYYNRCMQASRSVPSRGW